MYFSTCINSCNVHRKRNSFRDICNLCNVQFSAKYILYVTCTKDKNESQRLWLVRQRSRTDFAQRGRQLTERWRAQELRQNNYRFLRRDVIPRSWRSAQGICRKDPQFAFVARQERATVIALSRWLSRTSASDKDAPACK